MGCSDRKPILVHTVLWRWKRRGQEPQSREAELVWQSVAMRGHFCGGEAVHRAAGKENVSAAEAIRDLEKMHISYLNSTYDLQLLEQWKKETIKRCVRLRSCGETSWLPVCSGKCGNSFRKRESHVEKWGKILPVR